MHRIGLLFASLNRTIPGIFDAMDELRVALKPDLNPLLGLPVVSSVQFATTAGPIDFLFYGVEKVGCISWHGCDGSSFAIAVTLEDGELEVRGIAGNAREGLFAPFMTYLRACALAAVLPEPSLRIDPLAHVTVYHLPHYGVFNAASAR